MPGAIKSVTAGSGTTPVIRHVSASFFTHAGRVPDRNDAETCLITWAFVGSAGQLLVHELPPATGALESEKDAASALAEE